MLMFISCYLLLISIFVSGFYSKCLDNNTSDLSYNLTVKINNQPEYFGHRNYQTTS